MPQLDVATFTPQLVWLAITFVALYLVMSRALLPRIADVLEQRQDRIASDLEAAEKLKEEAEEAIRNYEKVLADARAEAGKIITQAKSLAVEDAAYQSQLIDKKLTARTREAEDRIREAKKAARYDIELIAVQTAQAVTQRLIGVEVTSTDTLKIVSQQLNQAVD